MGAQGAGRTAEVEAEELGAREGLPLFLPTSFSVASAERE